MLPPILLLIAAMTSCVLAVMAYYRMPADILDQAAPVVPRKAWLVLALAVPAAFLPATATSLGWVLLIAVLGALSAIDLKHQLLPDALTGLLAWSGLLFTAISAPERVAESVVAVAVGYLAFSLLARITACRHGGIADGDVKMMAASMAWLVPTPEVLLTFGLPVAAYSGLMLLRGQATAPLGPGLAAGLVVSLAMGHGVALTPLGS